MAKPHWVSKFLTEPWEINSNGDLAFYDFRRDILGRPTPSARLFRESKRDRPVALEERLNKLLETPLAKARKQLAAPGQLPPSDWRTYRAIVLTLFLQGPRTDAMERKSDELLSPILDLTDDDVDRLASGFMQKKMLVRLGSSNAAHSLFYPDGGMFSLPTRDPNCLTGWSWGMAVPLLPSLAFAWVSDSADCDWLFEQCSASQFLRGLSISGRKASRVVLPPDLATAPSDVVSSGVREYRRDMDAYRRQIQESRASYLKSLQDKGEHVVLVDPVTQRYGRRPNAETAGSARRQPV